MDKSKDFKDTFLSHIKNALFEYHPQIGQRVGNVMIRVDKK